jgi:hypothetical protein
MINISDYLKYFEEFGFEDPEFFKSGHAIQQCQTYLLEQMAAGVTASELAESETNCPELDRNTYVGGIGHLIAVALSFGGERVADIYNWAKFDKDDRDVIKEYVDKISIKVKPHLQGALSSPLSLPIKEIYKSKESRDSFAAYNPINDREQLMINIESDNHVVVDLITKCSAERMSRDAILYLRLARYSETLNVRQLLLGRVELARSEIHQKLLSQFSFVDKENNSIFSEYNPRWDPDLVELPAVQNYLKAHGVQLIQEVLISRKYIFRDLLHSSHEDNFREQQVTLLEQWMHLVKPTPEACANMYYVGIQYENTGFLLDLAERKDWLRDFCIDLAGDKSDNPLYEQAVKSFIQSIGVPTMVSAIATVPDDAQADELIAALYKKTNDPSLPPRLKNMTVLARVFCDDLSI